MCDICIKNIEKQTIYNISQYNFKLYIYIMTDIWPYSPPLSTKHFTLRGTVNTKQPDKSKYSVFSCTKPSLVMRSSDGKDLAVVSFRHSNTTVNNKLHIPRPTQLNNKINGNRTRIQVLTDVNNAPLVITVTNLCNDLIKFDFMKEDKKVNETDPPENLNQVNEIHPMQTYDIIADQTKDSRQIIISKKTSSAHKTGMTLEKEEQLKTDEKFGDYLYLQMSCKLGSQTEKYFNGAKWFITNYISVEHSLALPNCAKPPIQRYSSRVKTPLTQFYSSRVNESYLPRGGTAPHNGHYNQSLLLEDPTLSNSTPTSQDHTKDIAPGCAYGGYADSGSYPIELNSDQIYLNNNKKITQANNVDTDTDTDTDTDADTDVKPNVPEEPNSQQVNRSFVGEISAGEKVRVQSMVTGITYNYTLDTQVAVIGFSVIENSTFDFTSKADSVEYSHYKDRLLGDKLMDIKVYEQNTCIFCMTNKPHNIMYPCGHNCLCNECCGEFKKFDQQQKGKLECPVCRTNVLFTFVQD